MIREVEVRELTERMEAFDVKLSAGMVARICGVYFLISALASSSHRTSPQKLDGKENGTK